MTTFHDFPKNKTMVVMDGRRRICRANLLHSGMGWMLKADGFSWTDPRARLPNVFKIVAPQYLIVVSKREARRILMGLTHA